MLPDNEAQAFIDQAPFVWHQRFHLGPNVATPGANDIEWLLQRCNLPESLVGLSVLDVGTSNGGATFIAGALGATDVVSVDICEPDHFGFASLNRIVGASNARFVQSSLYELPAQIDQQFDIVLFLGVLYHLRHPLLGLDAIRRMTRGTLYLETAIDGDASRDPRARFYPDDELHGDGSNWFAPNLSCLVEWVRTSGFEIDRVDPWPVERPDRALVIAHPSNDPPPFVQTSYEVPLEVISRRPASQSI